MRDTALERFKRDVENFQKAASRITATAAYDGGPEPAAVAWLLKFLSTDLTVLNKWQKDEAFWNVYGFCFDGGQGVGTDFSRIGAYSLNYPETEADRTKAIAQIQKDAQAALTDYLKTGVGTFPKGEGALVVQARGNPILRYSGADLYAAFYWMAAQLLSRYGHRVKHCEGCLLIMLTGRKDQRFHSQSCQVASFFRTKRAKDKAARLAKERAKKLKTLKARKTTKQAGRKDKRKGGTRHGAKR